MYHPISRYAFISLLTCFQMEVLKACICSHSQGANHSWILHPCPPPPPPPRHGPFWANSKSDIGITAACGEQSRFLLGYKYTLLFFPTLLCSASIIFYESGHLVSFSQLFFHRDFLSPKDCVALDKHEYVI